jgi:hypothetical protein
VAAVRGLGGLVFLSSRPLGDSELPFHGEFGGFALPYFGGLGFGGFGWPFYGGYSGYGLPFYAASAATVRLSLADTADSVSRGIIDSS